MTAIATGAVFTGTITAAGNTATASVQPFGNVGGPVYAAVAITAVSGTTPTLVPKLQFSVDGTTWLAANSDETFPTLSAVGVTLLTVPSRAIYARVSWALPGGTSPSFTTAVAIWS
ncbi:hypothetical protein [Kribbella sp. NPDC004536]|uniref:hypothetical protein n=1 Tax=Kribbella sp. NPDC004536 TaxID=3364106 RepID=UPI003683A04C